VTSTIDVRLGDRFGNFNILEGTSVSFHTDYGAVDTSNVTDDTGTATAVWRSQAPYPPANGRVTILVHATGEENFTDNNMDGIYTAGTDTFIAAIDDLPEPFIDSNNNGSQDAGELFFDWPATVNGATAGTYNSGNTEWDASIPIWTKLNVWMTGVPDVTNSHIQCCVPGSNPCVLTTGNFTLNSNSYTTCQIAAADANNNALIGGTRVILNFVPSFGSITITELGNTLLMDGPVNGPAIVRFRLTAGTITTAAAGTVLQSKITWPGQCASGDWYIDYPGLISVAP
jgi:hypothetical protein